AVPAGAALSVPLVPGTPRQTGPSPVWWLAAGMAVVALAALAAWRISRRLRDRGVARAVPELAGVPLVVEDLVKVFGTGGLPLRQRAGAGSGARAAGAWAAAGGRPGAEPSGLIAVDGLSFRVERGQVCGLLGPNGAGKTTTLRALMGLVHPTSGLVRVFGEAVTPGAPVLS